MRLGKHSPLALELVLGQPGPLQPYASHRHTDNTLTPSWPCSARALSGLTLAEQDSYWKWIMCLAGTSFQSLTWQELTDSGCQATGQTIQLHCTAFQPSQSLAESYNTLPIGKSWDLESIWKYLKLVTKDWTLCTKERPPIYIWLCKQWTTSGNQEERSETSERSWLEGRENLEISSPRHAGQWRHLLRHGGSLNRCSTLDLLSDNFTPDVESASWPAARHGLSRPRADGDSAAGAAHTDTRASSPSVERQVFCVGDRYKKMGKNVAWAPAILIIIIIIIRITIMIMITRCARMRPEHPRLSRQNIGRVSDHQRTDGANFQGVRRRPRPETRAGATPRSCDRVQNSNGPDL